MLKDTRMTSFLILHQMANEKGVTRENVSAVILGYYVYSLLTVARTPVTPSLKVIDILRCS